MPPRQYTDDSIKALVNTMGFIKKDDNKNTIIGENVTIDTRSMGNFITADQARVTNSHNNIINAKNTVIENANGCRVDGADHTVKFGANYSCIDGDANWAEGYASKTSGTGNTNACYGGRIHGQNSRIGLKGQPNKFKDSSIQGANCEIDGSNSHAIGNFIRIVGDNITVIGNPPVGKIYNIPGVYIVNYTL